MGFLNILSGLFSDTYFDSKGYERYKENDKLVHRSVAEQRIKRPLKKGEVVHHIDRNKQNNSKSNLWVFKSQAEHEAIHKADAKKFGANAST